MKYDKKIISIIFGVAVLMIAYFVLAHFEMNDDGFHYEGFTESLALGKLDFKSFYGFQGLSFFAVPVFWFTKSPDSIILTSILFMIFSVPLAYAIGRDLYSSKRAGIYGIILFLLMPYPYITLMRGFQEAALLFFILLIIYGSVNKKNWTPVAWAIGSIVKPFALVLFPLFARDFLLRLNPNKLIWILIAFVVGVAYLGMSYYQTGHLINNAAINSYEGNFNTGNPPPLINSFALGIKGFLRVGANLFISSRKIMISPLVVLIGFLALYKNKLLPFRKEIILSIVLNILLVGALTFSFSKYLLPMAVLLSLSSIYYLIRLRWLMIMVFLDSIFVFIALYRYYLSDFWPTNSWAFWLPYFCAILLFILIELNVFKDHNYHSNPE